MTRAKIDPQPPLASKAAAALSPDLAAPAALTALALATWLSLPDKTFVFDGVIFSQVVERAVVEWRGQMFNPRHLLFNHFFQLLRDALTAIGINVSAYRLFQVVNSLAGAAGLLLFGDLARRLSRSAALGWGLALLLGATWTYGTRATEGQAYMLMSLGALAVLWSSARLLQRPTPGGAAALAGALSLSALFHAADAFLLPAAALAAWLAFPGRRGTVALVVAVMALLPVAAYLCVFGGSGWRQFLGTATDFYDTAGKGFWAGLAAKFWNGGGLSLPARLALVWRETGAAAAPLPAGLGTAAGVALWFAAAGAVFAAWPSLDAPRRATAAVLATAWAGFTAVSAFWLGGDFFYVPALACALSLLALAAGPRWAALAVRTRRRILGLLVFAGLGLGVWNVRSGLLPQSRIENNKGYLPAMFVGAHTVPSSVIVITGFGFQNSKVYLPNFAHRSREVLEYYFDQWPKAEALKQLADFAQALVTRGVPVYFLSDMVEGTDAVGRLTRLWGVSFGEIQNAFGPGNVVRIAASPLERVYLFVPEERRPELFVGLAYSVLTEQDLTLVTESAAALEEIAAAMTSPERRRAAELMRTTNWGFELFIVGFSPYMNVEARAAARARAERFAAYQQTGDFLLRAGNVYKILGFKDQAVAAWSRAQKMSGDQNLLRNIEELRKSR